MRSVRRRCYNLRMFERRIEHAIHTHKPDRAIHHRRTLTFDQTTNAPQVTSRSIADGAQIFSEMTAANVGKPLAIFLDGQLIEAPVGAAADHRWASGHQRGIHGGIGATAR